MQLLVTFSSSYRLLRACFTHAPCEHVSIANNIRENSDSFPCRYFSKPKYKDLRPTHIRERDSGQVPNLFTCCAFDRTSRTEGTQRKGGREQQRQTQLGQECAVCRKRRDYFCPTDRGPKPAGERKRQRVCPSPPRCRPRFAVKKGTQTAARRAGEWERLRNAPHPSEHGDIQFGIRFCSRCPETIFVDATRQRVIGSYSLTQPFGY